VKGVTALALLLAACHAEGPKSGPTGPAGPAAAPVTATGAPVGGVRNPAAADTAPAPSAEAKPEAEAPLEVEARESNPSSEKVKIKLSAWPVDAVVFWGNKSLGVAGKQPLEIERPRGSGPVDLVARAPGYLPFHTRVFTDRDERLSVRLVRVEDAPALLGYRRGAGGAAGTP
jgi:hypothetical protein